MRPKLRRPWLRIPRSSCHWQLRRRISSKYPESPKSFPCPGSMSVDMVLSITFCGRVYSDVLSLLAGSRDIYFLASKDQISDHFESTLCRSKALFSLLVFGLPRPWSKFFWFFSFHRPTSCTRANPHTRIRLTQGPYSGVPRTQTPSGPHLHRHLNHRGGRSRLVLDLRRQQFHLDPRRGGPGGSSVVNKLIVKLKRSYG
ncbi:hypothetical protein BC567DRAFT_283815 [Phyllosticta citribraziliensis]